MKKLLLLAPILALSFFCFHAYAATQEKPTFDQTVVSAYNSGSNADYLAGSHLKLGLECVNCHGDKATPDDNEAGINESCESCHADLQGMAKQSHEKYPKKEINAHESHLTDLSCTTCHTGHVASYPFCRNCHSFDDMTIPSQSGFKPVFGLEDLKVYENAVPNHTETTDIVVIGSGSAGFTAAVNAMQNGAKVILLEKMPITGGNSQIAAGGMNVAGTEYQKEAGVTMDTPEIMFQDTMKGGKNINDPKLVRILSNQSPESLKWLESIGGKLNHLSFSGGQTYKRVHTSEGGGLVGAYIVKTLHNYATSKGMDIRSNNKAVRLLTDKKGKVTGVRVNGKFSGIYDINAKAVILATGGFGANNPMVASFRPELFGTTTSNQPGAIGDGILLAQMVGADFTDMEQIQIHPTVALNTKILISESLRGSGAIMINKQGKRFVNEMRTRDQTSAAVLAQPGQTAFVVFDENIKSSMKQIDGHFKLGFVKQAKNAEELAKVMGVPADSLKASLATFNEAIKNKNDKEFGRKDLEKTLDHGNLYAIEVAPGIHHTMGGVKINETAQVIGKNGKPIEGLYAAGEITGGVHGGNRLGGNAMADTLTFGRIAGNQAAKYIK